MDSTKTYNGDLSTAILSASPVLTEIPITGLAVSWEENSVANLGYVDISLILGTSMVASDTVKLTFDQKFLVNYSGSGTYSCANGSGAALTCTYTYGSGYL